MNTGHTTTRTDDRAFVDALRAALRKRPIYKADTTAYTSRLRWFFTSQSDGNRARPSTRPKCG